MLALLARADKHIKLIPRPLIRYTKVLSSDLLLDADDDIQQDKKDHIRGTLMFPLLSVVCSNPSFKVVRHLPYDAWHIPYNLEHAHKVI